jgi:Ser/Thr protein kinase RdoA (MazF antagonist)
LAASPLVDDVQRALLKEKVLALPDDRTCLHGDFQPGNLLLADGKCYWIDLGWLAQGCHLMDLAHLYKMMVEDSVIPQVQDLTHMTREQMLAFWDAFARAYTGRDDIEALNRELRPYAVLDLIRTFHLHAHDAPDFLAFLKSWISQALETV